MLVSLCFIIFLFLWMGLKKALLSAILVMLLSFLFAVSLILSASNWFGIMLLLLYSGGLLVIFLYMTALSYNPLFSFLSLKMSILVVFGVILGLQKVSDMQMFVANDLGESVFKLWEMYLLGAIMFFCVLVVNKLLLSMSSSLRPFS